MPANEIRVLVVDAGSRFLNFLKYLPSNIHVERCPPHLFRGPSNLLRRGIWRFTRDARIRRYTSKFDVVFCEYASSWAAVVSRSTNAPLVIRAHQYEFDYPENLEAVNWNNVDTLVTVSHHYAELARTMTPAERIIVVQNGIDASHIFTFKPSLSNLLCTYGQQNPRKRFYDLMLALRDYELHIGGEGSSYRVTDEAIRRFGLKHKLYGHVEIPSWLRDKEFFIFHSMDESCGVALLEAMACGLLCLSHDYAVAREILPDDYRYVYNEDLIRKLEAFMKLDPQGRTEHKLRLRSIIESRFDVSIQAEQFARLFHELCKS